MPTTTTSTLRSRTEARAAAGDPVAKKMMAGVDQEKKAGKRDAAGDPVTPGQKAVEADSGDNKAADAGDNKGGQGRRGK